MSLLTTIIAITFICVLLVDQLHVFEDFLFKPIWRLLSKMPYQGWSFKPFSCSLCMSWWANLTTIIITGNLSVINVLICLLMSYSTFVINDVLIIFRELWAKMIYTILHKINSK